MNEDIPVDTTVILSKTSKWHELNPGPQNPTDVVGLLKHDIDGDIEVWWSNNSLYGVFYELYDTDLIPLFGGFSREQMRSFARNHDDLVVADCGSECKYRWQLATREI